jgi:hypothetical protein
MERRERKQMATSAVAVASAPSAAAPRISLELDSPELAATYDEVGTRQFNHGKVLI